MRLSRIHLPISAKLRTNKAHLPNVLLKSPPKWVLCDHDGVLTSRPFEKRTIGQLWNWAIEMLDFEPGHPIYTDAKECLKTPGAWPEHFEAFEAMAQKKHGRHLPAKHVREKMDRAIRRFAQEYDAIVGEHGAPPKGMPELLRFLESRGSNFGVVTSGLGGYSKICLPRLGFARLFPQDRIVSVEEVELERERGRRDLEFKPSSGPWQVCLERMGAEKSDSVLLIEDNPKNGVCALDGLLEQGWQNVTLIIITRDGNTFDSTAALMDTFLTAELEQPGKLTEYGFLQETIERILLLTEFTQLEVEAAA